jgi:hypothetical protein
MASSHQIDPLLTHVAAGTRQESVKKDVSTYRSSRIGRLMEPSGRWETP